MAKSKRLKVAIVADGRKQEFSGTGEPAALVCAFRAWLELGARFEMAEGADALDREVLGLEREVVRVKFADREVVYGSEAEAREHLERLRGDLARGVRPAALVVEADGAMGVPSSVAAEAVRSVPGLAVEVVGGGRIVSEVVNHSEVVLSQPVRPPVRPGLTADEPLPDEAVLPVPHRTTFSAAGEAAVLAELRREVFFDGNPEWYDMDRIRGVVNAPIDMIRRVLGHLVRIAELKARPKNGRTEWSRA